MGNLDNRLYVGWFDVLMILPAHRTLLQQLHRCSPVDIDGIRETGCWLPCTLATTSSLVQLFLP